MLWIKKSFDSYLLSYKSGFVSGSNPLEAAISCYTRQPWQQVGRILFYDGNSVPQNQTYGQDLPSIHFHLRRFSDVMHILLNEKPLYLRLNTNSFYGDIATSTEPIGEGES
jgi:hypothetical protein